MQVQIMIEFLSFAKQEYKCVINIMSMYVISFIKVLHTFKGFGKTFQKCV